MSQDSLPFRLLAHAHRRLRQRGIPDRLMKTFLLYADWGVGVGAGCWTLRGNDAALAAMRENNEPTALIDAVRSLIAILGPDGCVVTVMHDTGRRGRRYRWNKNAYRPKRRQHNLHGRRWHEWGVSGHGARC